MVVLIAGSSGQLGQSLQFIAKKYPQIVFHFYDSSALDITDFELCQSVFSDIKPDFCINAAAYTAVDKAESEPEKAQLINVTGAANLAKACKAFDAVLIHISTDFVFDGNKKTPYTENDIPNPTGVYGQTKLDGELAIQEIWNKHFIIRTSWVYSQFGNNFMKTMLRLGNEKTSLSVVNDQMGTPTHAVDLAMAIVAIIQSDKSDFGLYHYSNEGQISWYDFAAGIFEINHISIDLIPIPTTAYPTPAKRPAYSVLDKTKIKTVFDLAIPNWETSLQKTVS